MSNRLYRKLCHDPEVLPVLSDEDAATDNDESAGESVVVAQSRNLFAMLDDDDDDENVEEEDVDDKLPTAAPAAASTEKSAKKKSKKQKKKSKRLAAAAADLDNEDIEACIKEVDRLCAANGQTAANGLAVAKPAAPRGGRQRSTLLSVDHRLLQPERELRRVFGNRVVQEQQQQRRQQRGAGGATGGPLVAVRPEWPPTVRLGLQMRQTEPPAGAAAGRWFAVEHSREYQRTQMLFYEAVNSLEPENIRGVLHRQPYHVDALLQFADVFRAQEDAESAVDLLLRCLHAFQTCFHASFSLAAGDCRLDFRQQENRGFFVALFRYALHLTQRACYRTALEVAKALLSLQPDEDPLGVLLLVDFLALMAGEHPFFLQLYAALEPTRHVSQLPNFAFSLPLCRRRGAAPDDAAQQAAADAELRHALLRFPGVLLPLLDKCGVQPDAAVRAAALFQEQSCSSGLMQLQRLYVARCHPLWKDPDTLAWLERCTRQLLEELQQPELVLLKEEMEKLRCTRYQRPPLNVLRHLWLSELADAPVELPAHLTEQQVLSYDPLPPEDSRNAYTRPAPRLQLSNNSNTMANFLRSLLPNFDPEAVAVADLDGAAAVDDGLLNTLAATVRDFLRDIQPVDVPLENAEGQLPRDDEPL